jgi:hypothetical protein
MRKTMMAARTRGIREAAWAIMIGISAPLAALYIIDDITGLSTPRAMFRLLPGLGAAAMLITQLYRRRRLRDRRHQPSPPVGVPPADCPDDVLALVRQGKKIQAIKAYRKLHGDISLKEAKAFVDDIAER